MNIDEQFTAYNDYYISWEESCRRSFDPKCSPVKGKIVRPNIECTNGYIHIVDTVMLDDSPPWLVGGVPAGVPWGSGILVLAVLTQYVTTYLSACL